MTIHINSFFSTGQTHNVCQDYAAARLVKVETENSATRPTLAVSDGCSSSPDTDIGSMTENETIEVFSNMKGANKFRVVADPSLSGEMRLFKKGGKVVFTKGDKLYSLSLK